MPRERDTQRERERETGTGTGTERDASGCEPHLFDQVTVVRLRQKPEGVDAVCHERSHTPACPRKVPRFIALNNALN